MVGGRLLRGWDQSLGSTTRNQVGSDHPTLEAAIERGRAGGRRQAVSGRLLCKQTTFIVVDSRRRQSTLFLSSDKKSL